MTIKNTLIFISILLLSQTVAAQRTDERHTQKDRNPVGVNKLDNGRLYYRSIYQQMLLFEKYGGPKEFIENNYMVTPKDAKSSPDNLTLILTSKTMHLKLSVDHFGRINLPLLKIAYDEDAELILDRKISEYNFKPQINIVVKRDGVYGVNILKIACEQALKYLRYADANSWRTQKCAGVKFFFAKTDSDAEIAIIGGGHTFRKFKMQSKMIPIETSLDAIKMGRLAFSVRADLGEVHTNTIPLAIVPIFE